MRHQAPQLYRLNPKTSLAFQWNPGDPNFSYPKWFEDMIVNGRAYIVFNTKEQHVSLWNKRGQYKGLPGDWICKDEYGHIFVVSQGTFYERYTEFKKPLTSPRD